VDSKMLKNTGLKKLTGRRKSGMLEAICAIIRRSGKSLLDSLKSGTGVKI